MSEDLQCPVDYIKVNENKIRIIALLVLVLGMLFLFTGYNLIILILLADFFTRAFYKPHYSPLGWLADVLVKRLNIAVKPTDRGPKRFAAAMGFVFVAFIVVTVLFNWHIFTSILTIMLCVFAFLESFVAFCVGCHVYTGLQWFQRKFGRA